MQESARGKLGTAGAAMVFVLAMSGGAAGAQNLLANPSFDDDASGWQLGAGTMLLWTDIVDASGCPNSGSALVPSSGDDEGQTASLLQCVTLHGEENLYASVWHRGYGLFDLRLLFYTAINCSTGPLTAPVATEAQDPDNWNLLTMVTPVPANANAVYVLLVGYDAAPHGLSVDDVMLTGQFPIFLDGFDGNDPGTTAPCRWGG